MIVNTQHAFKVLFQSSFCDVGNMFFCQLFNIYFNILNSLRDIHCTESFLCLSGLNLQAELMV